MEGMEVRRREEEKKWRRVGVKGMKMKMIEDKKEEKGE